MTRDHIKAVIAKEFQRRYNKNFYDLDEESPVSVLLEIDERIDSLEIVEFLFDVEDILQLKNVDNADPRTAKIKDIVDQFYNATQEKTQSS